MSNLQLELVPVWGGGVHAVASALELGHPPRRRRGNRQSAVLAVSVPHDTLQETVGLVAVVAPGRRAPSDLGTLQRFGARSLHPSKWPQLVCFIGGPRQQLPKVPPPPRPLHLAHCTRPAPTGRGTPAVPTQGLERPPGSVGATALPST